MHQADGLLCAVGIALFEYKGRNFESKKLLKCIHSILQIKLAGKISPIPFSKEFCLEKLVGIHTVFSKPTDVIKIRARHVFYCQHSY